MSTHEYTLGRERIEREKELFGIIHVVSIKFLFIEMTYTQCAQYIIYTPFHDSRFPDTQCI